MVYSVSIENVRRNKQKDQLEYAIIGQGENYFKLEVEFIEKNRDREIADYKRVQLTNSSI